MSAIIDYLMVTVYTLILFIVFVMAFMVVSKFTDEIDNTLGGDPVNAQAIATLKNYEDRMPVYYDWALVLVIFLFWFGVVAGTYLLDNLPVFVVFFLILAILTFAVSLPLVNVIYALSLDSNFQQYFDSFPATMFFVTNWVYVITFFIISIVGAFVMKSRRGADFA